MIDEHQARDRAAFECDEVVLGGARALNEGSFFRCVFKRGQVFCGVIVNKETGRLLRVMTHTPMERDPTLYDRGINSIATTSSS